MKKNSVVNIVVFVLVWLAAAIAAAAAGEAKPMVLFDFGQSFDIGSVTPSDCKATLSETGSLRIETGHNKPWPGIVLKAPEGKWDLSESEYVAVDVTNLGPATVTVHCRVDNPVPTAPKTA